MNLSDKDETTLAGPKEGVRVSTDNNVNLLNLRGHLHVQHISSMAKSNQDVDSFLRFQALCLNLNTKKIFRIKKVFYSNERLIWSLSGKTKSDYINRMRKIPVIFLLNSL